MADSISIPGFSNKSNTQESIDKIMKSKRKKLDRLQEQKEDYIEYKEGMSEIRNKALSLQKTAKKLFGFDSPFEEKISMTSNDNAFSVNVNKLAEIGEHSIKIEQKAKAHKVASRSLSKNYKIPSGDYLFEVGEKKLKFRFDGGDIGDFRDVIVKEGKGILKASLANDSFGTNILLLESDSMGKENRISAGNEKTEELLNELGFIQPKDSFDKEYEISKANIDVILGNVNQIYEGKVTVNPDEKFRFNFSDAIKNKQENNLVLELKINLTEYTPPKQNTAIKDNTSDNEPLKSIGDTELFGIELEGEYPAIDLPLEMKDGGDDQVDATSDKTETEKVVKNRYIELLTDRRVIELDQFDPTKLESGIKLNLEDYLDNGEQLQGLYIKNKNNEVVNELTGVRVYNDIDTKGYEYVNELSPPQDSIIYFDGLTISKDSNTIDDVVKGVSINIFKETKLEESLAIDRDYNKILETVMNFIVEYNDFMQMIDDKTNENADSGDVGAFGDEYGLVSLTSKLRTKMMEAYPTEYGRELAVLSQIGIAPNKNVWESRMKGILEIDENKFIEMIDKYPDGVKELFANDSNRDALPDTGVAYEINELLQYYTERSTGYFASKTKAATERIDNQEKKINEYEEWLDEEERKLQEQFFKMEEAMQKLEENQKRLDNLNKQTK